MESLATAAQGSRPQEPQHTWWLTVYCYCTAVEAACYATLPGYGGRGTDRISALAGLVWWSRPDRQRCYTEALGCMAWLAGKRDWTARQPGHMYRYLSIYWYTTSIVAFHVECRGLQLRSTRRACQQRSIMGLTGRVDTPLCREGACSLTMNCVGGLVRKCSDTSRVFAMRSESPSIAGTSTVQNALRTRWGRCTLTPLSLRARSEPAQLQRTPTVSASSPQVAPPPHVIHLEQREKKKFCYRVATEWINWINPHTPELLNTLTCHGQPPADLAIWGSSQLLLALPSILARPLALLSDGTRCVWAPTPEAQKPRGPAGGRQAETKPAPWPPSIASQNPARDWLQVGWPKVTPMASALVSLWPGLAWTGVASDEISRANAKQLAAAHSHFCPPPSPPLPSTA
ncbi:hypothetical protein M431DRAFT_480513 [Trichoderma harzianum CBS 226.95]|uniref:Uncharacterized protein n=1 Tax=Trichoderma harzianum CBS 226.95 TaxID=983964 RepID=A0A2T4AIJ7_TRIHA|nr:hypothetical protein M431DRAFT_480513 [Trichoderma harzianum CBS 226.95]PTB56886.1 hypothetical protein M431DRAFT_480513 [Trichoderma harzianum CBS 226.95]